MGIINWLKKRTARLIEDTARTMVLAYKAIEKDNIREPHYEILRLTLKSRMDALEQNGDEALSEAEQEILLKEANERLDMLIILVIKKENPGVFSPGETNHLLVETVSKIASEYL